VSIFPKAFDFKYESIASILDINVKTLFTYTGGIDGKLCVETSTNKCEFGTTIAQFEDIWSQKLRALKFSITMYFKEKNGLTMTKFLIEKGDRDCRFNILNFLSPYWKEISAGGQEYRITFIDTIDETENNSNSSHNHQELILRKSDEIIFMKREDFWLARHTGERFSYQSAKMLNEPFRSINKSFINVFGLVLEYRESDAAVFVADMENIMNQFSLNTGCVFQQQQYLPNFKVQFKLNSNDVDNDEDFKRKRMIEHDNHLAKCQNFLKIINWNIGSVQNYSPFYKTLWGKMVGIVDYVDPIQAVIRTWELPFAVLPCRLKWSNNLMMVLSKDDDGKCLKFTVATEGEVFVVIASTPSNQKTWYTIHITTKGVILYRVSVPRAVFFVFLCRFFVF
jgi:hypothetical protein